MEAYSDVLSEPGGASVFSAVDETQEKLIFKSGNHFNIKNGIPLLISPDNDLFSMEDILSFKPLTQNKKYRNTKSIRNLIRQRLPNLCEDFDQRKRYKMLAEKVSGRVLIIGAGDKVTYYKQLFLNALVITSDVHMQFNPDIVFDAHQIPFQNNSFDLVLAAQVLEHTLNPWMVAQEIQRVTKKGGYIQIEVPQNYPYHGAPYDFFRFTFTGLRTLFNYSELEYYSIPEGNAATLAVVASQFFVDLFKNKYLRMVTLFICRIALWWLKYLDLLSRENNLRKLSVPKGLAMTFKMDAIKRSSNDMIQEYYSIKK